MKRTYTLVFKGYPIVRESCKREAIEEAIEKVFGQAKADDVRNWMDGIVTDSTYSDSQFAIHCLLNI